MHDRRSQQNEAHESQPPVENAPLSIIQQIARGFLAAPYTEQEFREIIAGIEEEILKLPQLPLVLRHTFAGGVYIREMEMPAGTTVTSRIHKKDHVVFLQRGSCLIVDQRSAYNLHAPCNFFTPAGTKRLIFSLTNVTWANAVHVHSTNPEDALEEMTFKTWEEWDAHCGLIPLPLPD